MARAMLPLLLCLSGLFISLTSGEAEPHNDALPLPQEFRSFEIQDAKVGRGCSYTVKIRTSCSSPRYTRDRISLTFGDVYRNEVYAPGLEDPSTGTFERCSTDTFKMQGPCGYGVCYLYVYRDGPDGWIPESIKVYEDSYSRTVTFKYGYAVPDGVWYGFNNCARASSSTLAAAGQGSAATATI